MILSNAAMTSVTEADEGRNWLLGAAHSVSRTTQLTFLILHF